MATKLRSENVSLEHQLADEVAQKERAQSENKELKEIWESEVKAKHKLTEKVKKKKKKRKKEKKKKKKQIPAMQMCVCNMSMYTV